MENKENPSGTNEPQGQLFQFVPGVGFVPHNAGQVFYQVQPQPQSGDPTATGFGAPETHVTEQDSHKYGEILGMVNDAVNGEPDLPKMLNFLESNSTDFWKGALIGAGAALLLTNDTVKGAVAGSVTSMMNAFKGKTEEE